MKANGNNNRKHTGYSNKQSGSVKYWEIVSRVNLLKCLTAAKYKEALEKEKCIDIGDVNIYMNEEGEKTQRTILKLT
jgi:hypothetical protein